MKNNKIIAFMAVVFLAQIIDGCKGLTDGYSTDPVNITDPSVIASSKYLTGIQVNIIGIYEADMARQVGMWSGYFSGEDRQYVTLAAYQSTNQTYDGEWGAVYSGVLQNSKLLKEKTNKEANLQTLGITQVMEAMSFGLMADLWGDAPLKEANQYPTIKTPKYDDQMSIYAAVQAKLDSALVNFTLSGNATGDIFYNGNITQYTAAVHTLKARYYLHVRDYANAITQSQLGISTASGDMLGTHGSAYLQNFNTYYSFMVYDRSGYMGANSYCPRLLDSTVPNSRNNPKTDETARLNYCYLPGGGANFSSIAYEPNVLWAPDWGTPPAFNGFFAATTSFPLVTFAENQLILAESLAKTNDFTNSLAALNSLRAYYNTGAHLGSGYAANYSYNYAQYAAADFSPGGMENADNITPIQSLLREVLEERYVSFIGQIEGFNDMRRTDNFLNLPVAPGQATYPKRLLYPQTELNTNLANVPTVAVGLFDPLKSFSTPY